MKALIFSFINDITEKFDNLIAFIGGDVLTTIFSVYFFNEIDWLHPIIKLAMTACIGIVGGFFGLLGKDVYTWAKKKLKIK